MNDSETQLGQSAFVEGELSANIPTIDELVTAECKLRDIRQYYERQGVLKCLQRLSEHSQKINDPKGVNIEESREQWHEGYSSGFMQAHKIIDAMLRES